MTPSAIAPVKFLLVGDEANDVSSLLAREGLELLRAKTGEEALELLLVHEVALALVDLRSSGMDGVALAKQMRGAERAGHVPVIFLAANPPEQRRVSQGYDAGAVDVLVKPFDADVLRRKADTFFRLAREKQELAGALRLTEAFVAAVGHDLRNPLNSIMMCAQLLGGDNADPPTRKIADRLTSSGRRMARMLEELFDLSRARQGGGLPIQRAKCDARAIAERVVGEHRTAAPGRAIELDGESRIEGDWDAGRLEQLLSNLLGDAVVRATAGPVWVRLAREKDGLMAVFHDDGVIAAETLPHLFQPFVSRPKGKNRGDGLGLGLFIAEQIALAHGGTIDVRSEVGEGTTFRVRLPDASAAGAVS